jgi:N-methylhydantoinase A
VLGYLNPDYFLGGEIKLVPELAEKAIKEKVADPLGMDVKEAAKAIRRIIDHNMVDGISVVSVQRGEDPRKYALVAAGGAGPVHAASLAETLGIRKILVPRSSSIFCALGGIIADLRHDFVRSVMVRSNTADPEILTAYFREMERSGEAYLEQEGISEKERYYRRSMDMRYKGQFHEVEVPLHEDEIPLTNEVLGSLVKKFNDKHEELYAYRDDVETEIINLRLAAYGKVITPSRKEHPFVSSDADQLVKTKRDVYFDDRDSFISTPIYDGDAMKVGNVVKGPAIVEQSTTTIVLPPKARLEVTSYGDYIMHLPE